MSSETFSSNHSSNSSPKHFSSIQFKDKNGNTPLHRAVMKPNCTVDSIKIYLHTSFLNAKNFLWHTPLHCIIMSNCHKIDVIELMINKGANVYAKDRNGSTVLHKAVQNPNCTAELIELLTENTALLSLMQYGTETPMMLAVRNRNHNLKILEKLFYNGCIDICMSHSENQNTLRILCSDLVLIKVFLQYSTYLGKGSFEYAEAESIIVFSCPGEICGFSSIKGKNFKNTDLATSLLMFAVKYPSYNLDVIRELMQKGAEIFDTNCQKRCAFEYALKNPACSTQLVQELLKDQRGVWSFTALKDCSFLHTAAANRSCPAEVMKILMNREMVLEEKLNKEDQHHLTPLDRAADCTRGTSCNLDVVETLLLNGALMCRTGTLYMTVLWKNIQLLGSPDGNLDVLNCTKLLVKYALVEKGNPDTVYADIIKLCARFRWRDTFRYFSRLESYLNKCYTEVMNMMIGPLNVLEFTLFINRNMFIDQEVQEVFELMVSNKFPMYRRLVITSLKKKVLDDNIINALMYTVHGNGNRIYLNPYCMQNLALYLENEDLFNLYLAFMNQNNTRGLDESISCSTLPPKKKCKLH